MRTALLLALLGSPDWQTREAADRALTGRLSYPAARVAWLTADCPEARARLSKHVRLALWNCIDEALPDGAPYWPDGTWARWPQENHDWPMLSALRDREADAPVWAADRLWFKQGCFEYLLVSDDWDYVRNITWAAWKREQEYHSCPDLAHRLPVSCVKTKWKLPVAPLPRCKKANGS